MKAKTTTPNPELNPLVRAAILHTWNYIASDAAELGCRTARDALELVLDAGRIYTSNRNMTPETKAAIDEFMKLPWKTMMKLGKPVLS